MLAYFRGHRRAGSSSTATPGPSSKEKEKRPLSATNFPTSQSFNSAVPSQSSPSKSQPHLKSQNNRFYAKCITLEEPENLPLPEPRIERSTPAPISDAPPVLPPIPRIAASVEDNAGHMERLPSRKIPKPPNIPQPRPTRSDFSPLKLNAVSVDHGDFSSDPSATSDNRSTRREGNTPPPENLRTATRTLPHEALGPQRGSRPDSAAYSVELGGDFSAGDVSPAGQGTLVSEKASPAISIVTSQLPAMSSIDDTQQAALTQRFTAPQPRLEEISQPSSTSSAQQVVNSQPPSNLVPQPSSSNLTLPSISSAGPTNVIKLGKPKRSLLNPVSLLMRRRQPQHLDLLVDKQSVSDKLSTAMSLPANYDPRIKGNVVHDFSAPRTRRNHSTNEIETINTFQMGDAPPAEEYKRRESVPFLPSRQDDDNMGRKRSPEREHTTAFFENFENTEQANKDSSAIHRETLANQSFLARNSETLVSAPIPALDDVLPPSMQAVKEIQTQRPVPSVTITPESSQPTSPVLEPVDKDQTHQPAIIEGLEKISQSHNDTPSSYGLLVPPQHQTSNSSKHSRFSFQLSSDSNAAQEHELEEKAKRRSGTKRTLSDPREQAEDDTSDDDQGSTTFDDDDDDDNDDIDDIDDQYEERIPGINADAEEEEEQYESRFVPVNGLSSQVTMSEKTGETAIQHVQQFNFSAETPNLTSGMGPQDGHHHANDKPATRGLDNEAAQQQETTAFARGDEMYFDDGLIEAISPGSSGAFDESIFDNPVMFEKQEDELFLQSPDATVSPSENADPSRKGSARAGGDLRISTNETTAQQPTSASGNQSANLSEYHDALALAAARAEADGKFSRSPVENTQRFYKRVEAAEFTSPGMNPASTALSKQTTLPHSAGADYCPGENQAHYLAWSPSHDDALEYNQFDDDDPDFDDSALIEAANAEVLASEDCEFYGREFDFYGNARKGREAFNGGYFGDANKDGSGLARHSSVHDPTLTPITERSEFSRAPSYMSLNTFGAPGNNFSSPLPSPGLRELANRFGGMAPEDISLKQLMKLRKETFGGSPLLTGGSGSSPSSFASSPIFMKNNSPTHPLAPEIPEEADMSDASSADGDHDYEAHGDGSSDVDRSSETSTPSPTTAGAFRSFQLNPAPDPRHSYFNHSSMPPFSPLSPPRSADQPGFPHLSSTPSPVTASTPASPAMPVPLPPPTLMQKFTSRPPASSATFAERQAEKTQLEQKRQSGANLLSSPIVERDSVAYVLDRDQWYLEKRRTLGSGEVIVLARDLIEGGRI